MELSSLVQEIKSSLAETFSEREINGQLAILLEHYLGITKSQYFIAPNAIIPTESIEKIRSALNEIKNNKPIDYIIGKSIFYGREFKVNKEVLIPRSETEELVLLIIENERENDISILDIGTGSGCIPITLKLEQDYRAVKACEVSRTALDIAKQNAHLLNANIDLFEMDILTEIPEEKFDVVVSNPPYVKVEEMGGLDANVREYEPEIALTPGEDPLLFYKRMVEIAPKILKPMGRFYWEIHEDLGKEVMQLLSNPPFMNVKLYKDLFDRDRFVSAIFYEAD